MNERLERLAEKLHEVRRHGNQLTLKCVLESAHILREARSEAGRQFGRWLETVHMDRSTASRHLRVARMVEAHVELTQHFATLSIAKLYALSRLDLSTSRRILLGEEVFSKPIDRLTDVEFRLEFREKYPPQRKKRRTRYNTHRSLKSAVSRLEKAILRVGSVDPALARRLMEKWQELSQILAGWKVVA